jgi:uncharacterized membrane protein
MRIASVGQAVFAATLVGIGILGLIQGDFVSIWQPVPKGFPARELLPYLCALVALAGGAGLFFKRTATPAARLLLIYLVLWALVFKARFILIAPLSEGVYQTNGENAVLVAAAWVLYAGLAGDWDRRHLAFAAGERGVRIARVLYGLAMIGFGLSHFAFLNLTAPLVPGWLPGHTFWAYFTGTAYLAAAAAILSGVWARLAALLSTLQMAGFTFLVWPPLVLAGTISPSQWGEFLFSWTLTAAGWVVLESYRGSSWFAVVRMRAKV